MPLTIPNLPLKIDGGKRYPLFKQLDNFDWKFNHDNTNKLFNLIKEFNSMKKDLSNGAGFVENDHMGVFVWVVCISEILALEPFKAWI